MHVDNRCGWTSTDCSALTPHNQQQVHLLSCCWSAAITHTNVGSQGKKGLSGSLQASNL